ncbi:FKBP-type peptidyl-prolyl cis-trans isomerase [Glycocaulis sp.]|uniref:FKBP-type peptidyl-prolyl cis-trans isomerase n=1 Tax=Glycocaulis sp. TaxID=1969725 RepID=UPI003F6F6814
MHTRLALTASLATLLLAACGESPAPDERAPADESPAVQEGVAAPASQQSRDDAITLSPLEPEEDAETFRARVEGMSEEDQAAATFQRELRMARGCEPGDAPLHRFEPRERGEDESSADYNGAIAAEFLRSNVEQPCVYNTSSGLQFRIERAAGPDNPSPVRGEYVRVHYAGQLLDGTEFDSSYARGEPAQFPSDRLIAGWVEALPLMRVGEKWTLYIAPELGYGARGTPGGPIPPNAALVFQLELLGLPDRE